MYEQKYFVLKYNYFFKRSMKILQMPQNLRDTLYSKQSIRRFSHHQFKKCPANFRTSYLLREGAEGLKIWGEGTNCNTKSFDGTGLCFNFGQNWECVLKWGFMRTFPVTNWCKIPSDGTFPSVLVHLLEFMVYSNSNWCNLESRFWYTYLHFSSK